jgi:outer membrane biosynthesis protein TonB
MKFQVSQSIDFNQMLVFSVFGHLLLLTAVLFFPKPSLPKEVIVPAFMVNLVSGPAGFKSDAEKRINPSAKAKKPDLKKVKKKITASKPSVMKKVSRVTTPKPKKVLEELSKLETNMAIPAPKNMVEELDQLARLEKPKPKPKPKPLKAKPVKSVSEETFRELETLKNKKVNEVKAIAPPLPSKDVLMNFEELKLEDSLPEPLPKKVPVENSQKLVSEEKESEKPKGPAVDLLKQLQQLAKLDPTNAPEAEIRKPKEITQGGSKSFDSIIDKFSSLSVESDPVKVEVSSAKLEPSKFKSKLRTLPKGSRAKTKSSARDSYVFANEKINPDADVQSLYAGMVQDKVFKNWKEPLAEEHSQETVVSFLIFSHGNIDKPFIKKSSGVGVLDSLAVRAVLDSTPFPEFPKELKMSNLRINIYFKYVSKDN